MVQVYIPKGEFLMGFTSGAENEKPEHTVYLDDYWMDKTEVTNKQYGQCVAANVCAEPMDLSWQVSSIYKDLQYTNHPVVFVDRRQAETYCAWTGRRLPTEAEWEKAARGTDGRLYPWGNLFDGSRVNFCDVNCWNGWKDSKSEDGYATTSPVGTYLLGASPFTVLDMAGNVYEWVADISAPYSSGFQMNPLGPSSGSEYILRGGSWGDDSLHVRTVIRSDEASDFRRDFIGFRCAQSNSP
jgi:eukaryotic-like serine/threonine-protein kinase